LNDAPQQIADNQKQQDTFVLARHGEIDVLIEQISQPKSKCYNSGKAFGFATSKQQGRRK